MKSALLPLLLIGAMLGIFSSCGDKKVKENIPTSGAFAKADVKAISEKIASSPDKASLYFERGNLLHQYGEDSFALNDYKKAVKLDSLNAQYYSAIGDLMFEHKDIDGSVTWLEKALKLDPEDPTARLKVAKLLIYLRDYNKAFTEINIVLRKDAYNVEGYFLKGIIRKELKDTAAALSSFMTALQIDPTYKDASVQLGLLHSAKKDPTALQYLENAFKADTSDVFPLYAKGMFHQNAAAYDAAKGEYRRAIRYNKQYADAYYNIGWILIQQDSLEKAQQQFDLVTTLQPDNAGAHYNKGLCLELLGRKDDAVRAYRQALSFDVNYADAANGVKRLGGQL